MAVAHGGLELQIGVQPRVSQPAPLANGDTRVVDDARLQAKEVPGKLKVVGGETTLADLAAALNTLGATPRDLIGILEAIDAAGALHADLEIL